MVVSISSLLLINIELLQNNGVNVVEVSILGDSAFSLGSIYVGQNVADNQRLLAHEYGHCVQLEEVGMTKYLQFVAIPSVTCWLLTEVGIFSDSNYYNRPWECIADMYGNVSRNHAQGAEDAAKNYWEAVKSIEYAEIRIF